MPKPIGPEPDSVPIHEQVRALIHKAHKDRMAPIGIVFSQEGYAKALGQTVPGMSAWNNMGTAKESTHYLGFPFTVSTSLTQGDVLLDLVPGGSPEAKAFRERQRQQPTGYATPTGGAVRLTAKGPMDRPTIEVLAEGLTVPQMCNLIDAWVKAHAGPATPFQHGLMHVLEEHGRFE